MTRLEKLMQDREDILIALRGRWIEDTEAMQRRVRLMTFDIDRLRARRRLRAQRVEGSCTWPTETPTEQRKPMPTT
jgi:hypothetical protein